MFLQLLTDLKDSMLCPLILGLQHDYRLIIYSWILGFLDYWILGSLIGLYFLLVLVLVLLFTYITNHDFANFF
jgi:hypothetical protein